MAGVDQLSDNSFFTHLATGRLIWEDGFPRTDAYSFTSAGDAWFPQSWLASVLYGGMDRLGGSTALRLQFAVSMALLAGAGWALTRPAGHVTRRLLAVSPFLAVGIFGWSHRPYLLAFGCLAAVLLAVEGRIGDRWLLLVGWVWVNVHGSWPLGLLAIVVLLVGRRLDRADASRERAVLSWFTAGLVVGCLNPYGPRVLAFPLVAVERRDVFVQIQEWQAPTFDGPGQLVFLTSIALAVVAVRRRPSWRGALTLVVFLSLALVSARNLPVAALLLLPLTAEGLAGGGPDVPDRFRRAASVLAVALVAVGAVVATSDPGFDEARYPVEAARSLQGRDLGPTDATWVTQDFVGNWLALRDGAQHQVFIDDRFELVPDAVIDHYRLLLEGRPGWEEALEAYDPDVVVWERDSPLAELLAASDCWELVHRDERFVAAVPAGSC